jgi:CubicO group peptidase (beta-lactamase class C family)
LPEMPPGAVPDRTGDWDWVIDQLASMAPTYPPGTTNVYHSTTWGWLVGELVRRTDPHHRPFCTFVHDEILVPLKIDDCWMILPPSADDRLATLSGKVHWPGRPPTDLIEGEIGPSNYRFCAPSGGAVMSAHSGARFFAMLAGEGALDGVRLLPAELVRHGLQPRPDPYAPDVTAGRVRWIGQGGWWLGGEAPPADPLVATGRRVLWHPGLGGSAGWADLDRGLGVVICHNRLFDWEGVQRDTHPFGQIAQAIDQLVP